MVHTSNTNATQVETSEFLGFTEQSASLPKLASSKPKLCPSNSDPPNSLSPLDLGKHHSILCLSWSTLDSSFKWKHTTFLLLFLASVTWRIVFKVYPCVSICQDFLSLKDWILFYYIYCWVWVVVSPGLLSLNTWWQLVWDLPGRW